MSMRGALPAGVRVATLAGVALLAALSAGGCSKAEPGPQLTVRGAIENLTEAHGKPVALIRHEAIPDFVDGYGEKRTMESMAMAFGVSPGVSLDGLEIGDKVEIRFHVDRERYPTFHITAVRELPADTALQLSE